jgi:hypothetical protein
MVDRSVTFHDVRERQEKGAVSEVEQWRMAGGRMYEKTAAGEELRVRVVAGGRGIEIAGAQVRPLRPAQIEQWHRKVRLSPLNFEAHAVEMQVVTTREGEVERLEAVGERMVLVRDARTGIPRRTEDLRLKTAVEFDQPRDAQGRHVPRLEVHLKLDREVRRDRIGLVEFDRPVPAEVLRLWEALEAGRGI